MLGLRYRFDYQYHNFQFGHYCQQWLAWQNILGTSIISIVSNTSEDVSGDGGTLEKFSKMWQKSWEMQLGINNVSDE